MVSVGVKRHRSVYTPERTNTCSFIEGLPGIRPIGRQNAQQVEELHGRILAVVPVGTKRHGSVHTLEKPGRNVSSFVYFDDWKFEPITDEIQNLRE